MISQWGVGVEERKEERKLKEAKGSQRRPNKRTND